MRSSEIRDVIVVGGGLAGLSASIALAGVGAKVTILERQSLIGGRAYSYDHTSLGEKVDSQHVVVGACTNFLELCRQAGIADAIRWYDELIFLEPGGRRSLLYPGKLPAPAQRLLSLLRTPMLGLRDKIWNHYRNGTIFTGLSSFANWLKRTGQTERSIRHFWEPIVVGTLNDVFERCSVKYVGKVFHECFIRSSEGGRLGVPMAPISDFFAPLFQLAQSLGIAIEKVGVQSITQAENERWQIFGDGQNYSADAVILATDFRQTQKLLSTLSPVETNLTMLEFERFIAAPITTIHLWYDRDVTQLDYTGLLDTRIKLDVR